MKNYEVGSREWLFVNYTEVGEKVTFESVYGGLKNGIILSNYKNGEFRVEYDNGKAEEIIGVEQILF